VSTTKGCTACGESHDYDAEACENFLTFGQGGADFEESQRIAELYDEESRRAELQAMGCDILIQSHERKGEA
jgi:hypothetical protein